MPITRAALWVMMIVMVGLSWPSLSLYPAGPTEGRTHKAVSSSNVLSTGYWVDMQIQSYYPLSESMLSRNGKTIYGGNLFVEGAASKQTYPRGTFLYVEALEKWVIIDDKIPGMEPGILYLRILTDAQIKTASRVFVMTKPPPSPIQRRDHERRSSNND